MIHNVLQNSEAWINLRASKLTASEVGEWIFAEPKLTLTSIQIKAELDRLGIPYKKSAKVGELAALLPADIIKANQGYLKKDTQARDSTMCRMLGRSLSPVTIEWTGNRFTDFGHAFEDEAATDFELRTGLICEKVGFVTLDGFDHIGASPDRYVYTADKSKLLGPLEIKCKPEEHVRTVIDGIIPPEHRLQVHFQIILAGTDKGYFYAYSPDMQPLLLEVKADSFTERLGQALVKFDTEYQAFRAANLPKLKIA